MLPDRYCLYGLIFVNYGLCGSEFFFLFLCKDNIPQKRKTFNSISVLPLQMLYDYMTFTERS